MVVDCQEPDIARRQTSWKTNKLPESSDTKKQHAISRPFPLTSRPDRIPQVDEAVSELASLCTKRLSGEEGPGPDWANHARSALNGEVTHQRQPIIMYEGIVRHPARIRNRFSIAVRTRS